MKTNFFRRAASLLLSLLMVFSGVPAVYAAEGSYTATFTIPADGGTETQSFTVNAGETIGYSAFPAYPTRMTASGEKIWTTWVDKTTNTEILPNTQILADWDIKSSGYVFLSETEKVTVEKIDGINDWTFYVPSADAIGVKANVLPASVHLGADFNPTGDVRIVAPMGYALLNPCNVKFTVPTVTGTETLIFVVEKGSVLGYELFPDYPQRETASGTRIWTTWVSGTDEILPTTRIEKDWDVKASGYFLLSQTSAITFEGIDWIAYVANGATIGNKMQALPADACSWIHGGKQVTENTTVEAPMSIMLKKEHDKKVDEAVAPTCVETGLTEGWHCTMCSKQIVAQEIVPATGHSHTAVITPPTCTEDGFTTYTCACGDTYTANIVAATGHSHVADVTPPTCIAGGYTTYVCPDCGDIYVADQVAAKGHSYSSKVTAPTCTEDGFTTYTCGVCGHTYEDDVVLALGHSYTSVVTAPTCTKEGYTTYTCACGDVYVADRVAATGHSYSTAVTAPTCTAEGYTTYTCACGDTYVADKVAAFGHDYKASFAWNNDYTACGVTFICGHDKNHVIAENALIDKETVPAKCTEDGKNIFTAIVEFEGEIYTDIKETVIPAIGHAWDNGVVTTAPGCTDAGVLTYTCGNCKITYTEAIDAEGHAPAAAVKENAVPATCTADGSYDVVVYCSVCEAELSRKTEVDPMVPHKAVVDVLVAPTCEGTGLSRGTHCADCGEVLEAQQIIPALGHTASDWKYSETEHWKVCTVETCGELIEGSKGVHGYDDWKDTVCNVCGYDRTSQYRKVTLAGGHLNESGAGKYFAGETVTIYAGEAFSGYAFAGWESDDVSFANANAEKTTFVMPDSDVTVTATWTAVSAFGDDGWMTILVRRQNTTYNITAQAGVGGSISNPGTSKVKYNKGITYTITPDAGYEIESVKVNGKDVGAVAEYTFKNVKSKQEISVTFKKTAKSEWVNPFTDISKSDEYYAAVEFAYENNLFKGTSDTTFAPMTTMSRGMFVTVLGRLAGVDTTKYTDVSFRDVTAGQYYSPYVAWAVENGIALGYGDNVFGVDDEVTVEQAIVFIARFAKLYNIDLNIGDTDLSAYADINSVSEWALVEMLWALGSGVYRVDSADLVPKGKAARALVAEMIYNFCEAYKIIK